MQERRNSIANALELRLSCTNPSICNTALWSTVKNLWILSRVWVTLRYAVYNLVFDLSFSFIGPWFPTIHWLTDTLIVKDEKETTPKPYLLTFTEQQPNQGSVVSCKALHDNSKIVNWVEKWHWFHETCKSINRAYCRQILDYFMKLLYMVWLSKNSIPPMT